MEAGEGGRCSEDGQETEVLAANATGAGDLFAAGFLAGLSQGKSLEICGKMGNISAGEVISSMGARPQTSLQDLFEINKL